MFNYFDNQSRSDIFVQYLNHLVSEHYGALYHRKKWSPVTEDVLGINTVLGIVLFACAGHYPYPESEITHCGIEAQRQLPPAKLIYNEWVKKSIEGAVSLYCDCIDKVVDEHAAKNSPNKFIITCSIAPRITEIVQRLHSEIEACNKQNDFKKRVAI